MKAKKLSAAIVVAAVAGVSQQLHAQTMNGAVDAGEYTFRLAVQTDPTDFGKGYNELDAAYANVLSDGSVQLMFTGNLEDGQTGSGNGFNFFLQTRNDPGTIASVNPDGSGVLDDIGGARSYKWGSANSGVGSILSPGFNPNFSININNYGNTFYTDIVDTRLRYGSGTDEQPGRVTYLGSNDTVGGAVAYTFSPAGVPSGTVTTAYNNDNRTAMLGVNAWGSADAGDPTTNPLGWELLLSPEFLHAKPGQEIRVLPYITNSDGGYLSNQFLFNGGGLPNGTDNLGYNAPLFDSRTWGSQVYVAIPQPTLAGDTNVQWADDSQWNTQHAPNGINTTAVLSGTKTVTDDGRTVGALIFESGSVTIDGVGVNLQTFGDNALVKVEAGQHFINNLNSIQNDVDFVIGGQTPMVETPTAHPPLLAATSLTIGQPIYAPSNGFTVSGAFNGTLSVPSVAVTSVSVDTATLNLTGNTDNRLGQLTINNAGTVNLGAGKITASQVVLTNGGKLSLGSGVLSASGVSVDNSSTLDIGTGLTIVNYSTGSGSPASDIRGMIANARNGGTWDGGGITSSAAGSDTSMRTAVAYAEASQLGVANGGTFDDQTIPDQAVIVKFTYVGDNDLDGKVTLNDFSIFVDGFNGLGSGWVYGDYDYSGTIDPTDFSMFVDSYRNQGSQLSSLRNAILSDPDLSAAQKNAMLSVVPEPGTLAIAAMAVAPMLMRRRRGIK